MFTKMGRDRFLVTDMWQQSQKNDDVSQTFAHVFNEPILIKSKKFIKINIKSIAFFKFIYFFVSFDVITHF
jgi:hypothetical protein